MGYVKCKECLVEMHVMMRNSKQVGYQCPKCKEMATISIEEEQNIINLKQEDKET